MKAEYIDHMGSDLRVVNAARVSFDKESDWDPELTKTHPEGRRQLKESDAKLIRYLARNNHFTPFTHCVITLRETVPIFVARQRFKHTVGFSYNEVSRRYVDSDPDFYTPVVWRKRAENVKQGSSDEDVSLEVSMNFSLRGFHKEMLRNYKLLLDCGVAPEQARMVLPQSAYTSYYVTGSLAAWARAYKLRSDFHAQQEIQELAAIWNEHLSILFPVSWKALTSNE